jgi:MATE family multidrug resistance protein
MARTSFPHSETSYYRRIIQVCLPLVLSLSATTLMEFTDRVFLANYSLEAISAALPAGITNYLFIAFLGGVGSYIGVFIAQYTGRGDLLPIGRMLWQGIYLTVMSTLLFWGIDAWLTTPIFALADHPPEVRQLEEQYFSILCRGGGLHVGMVTLAAFFSGRGITRPVMIITFIGVLLNVPLDYCLIYGACGLPELGIGGAAIATVIAWAVNVLCLAHLIFTRNNEARFGVCRQWRLDVKDFMHLLRFGVPAAIQFTLDILAFTLFVLLVGRIGKPALAATNIVLSINALAFMPSAGFAQGISVLVGQALGTQDIAQAKKIVISGAQLLCLYILAVDILFIVWPGIVLSPFLGDQMENLATVSAYSRSLLKIVAAYLFFDALYMVLTGALRGAGDTRFPMLATLTAAPCCLVLPVYYGIHHGRLGVVGAWLWVLLFVFVLFSLAAWRYLSGKWQNIRLIENEPPV